MSYVVDPVTLDPFPQQTVTTGQEVLPGFCARVSTTGGAVTVLAPEPTAERVAFMVQDLDGNAAINPITIDGNSSLIDGAATLVLSTNNEIAVLVYDDGQWRRLLTPRVDNDGEEPHFRASELTQWIGPAAASFGDVGPRLSLSSTLPVTTADATSTSVYLVPMNHAAIVLWDGSQFKRVVLSAVVTKALSGMTAGLPVDFYAALSGASVVIEVANWLNSTTPPGGARGTDPMGRACKGGDATRLLIAAAEPISATQVTDTEAARTFSNVFNTKPRKLKIAESTGSWTYAVATTWRQARATASNKVRTFTVKPRMVELRGLGFAQAGTSAETVYIGIGLDRTNNNDADLVGGYINAAAQLGVSDAVFAQTLEGLHDLNWLEWLNGTGTTTFFGGPERGLTGTVEN